MSKTFGIFSLKGGVGKTTVVISLGSAIAGFGKKVLLVDGNLSAPNLGISFDIANQEFSFQDVLERKANPSQAVSNLTNMDILPASIFSTLNANPMQMKEKIRHLKRSYDFILIDSAPSLNEEALGAMLASDEILVVTTPDHPTLSSTLKSVKFAKQRGIPISGLILNKVYNKNFEIPIIDIERIIDVPVMAVIPHDINILKALSQFTSSVDFKPHSEASEEYKKLAATLIGEKYSPIRLRNLLGWISPKKQDINRTIFYDRIFR